MPDIVMPKRFLSCKINVLRDFIRMGLWVLPFDLFSFFISYLFLGVLV